MEHNADSLTISAEWLSGGHGLPEIGNTSALIGIKVGETFITAVEDRWSRSTRTDVALSAYPLALWFASSWWRLRWEALPDWSKASNSWRMAHEAAAANHGFLWPNLRFESDGSLIEIVSQVSNPKSKEMIRYLTSYRGFVTAKSFEKAVDDFIVLVIGRLDALEVKNTELHQLWAEVVRERNDSSLAKWRRLEASAGFDPGELSEDSFKIISQFEINAGRMAAAEVAACCRGSDPKPIFASVSNQASSARVRARIPALTVSKSYRNLSYEPWQDGRMLANDVRRAFGLGSEPISSKKLSDILSMPKSSFDRSKEENENLLGLAIKQDDGDELRFSFQRSNSTGRRFEAARLLCDALLVPKGEKFMPSTDAKTSRQKIQRAFAAEFLCPIESLKAFVGTDSSTSNIERAANHFEISPLAIASHLTNHRVLSPERLSEFNSSI